MQKQPFAFTRGNAQCQKNDSEGHLNAFPNFVALPDRVIGGSGMRITIQPQDDARSELGIDRELRRAFNVLDNALIRTRG